MSAVIRYLALAFASADLLIEVDGAHRIVFSLGADGGERSGVGPKLVGRHLAELIATPDNATVAALLSELAPGQRRGPIEVRLKRSNGGTRTAGISVFALPELAPNISCSLTFRDRTTQELAEPELSLDPGGFRDQVRLLLSNAAHRGQDMALSLIEIDGLTEARHKLAPETVSGSMSEIRRLLARSGADGAATGLSETRYAVLQEQANDLEGLVRALNNIAVGSGLSVTGQSTPLLSQKDPLHQFRAVRIALDSFIQSGLSPDPTALRRGFTAVLDDTARSASRLATVLNERRFGLQFQPVVDLKTELAIHYEVLVRFDHTSNSTATIKLAEDLEMVEALDGSVVEQAVRRLRAPGADKLKLAVNISGGTLLKDGFLQRLLTVTNPDLRLRQRLQLEITETAALRDLEAAARRMKALKMAGFSMAIDDFGAGAAGFEYVRALPVDAVKIDGRYIRGLDRDPRSRAIVKHLVQLCEELDLNTVAEMIECEEELAAVRAAGVRCGQGYLYGKAESEPCPPRRQSSPRARRMGGGETRR